MSLRTQTKTKVQSVTTTKLLVATLVMLVAGGAAFAMLPLSKSGILLKNNPPKADLVIEDIKVSVPLAGDRRIISFKIANQGNFNVTSSFDVELYRTSQFKPVLVVFSGWVNGLAAGASQEFNQTVVYREGYMIEVDKENRVSESNENNNSIAGDMDSIDLSITSVTRSPYRDGQILRSGFLWFDTKVKNSGNVTANNVKVRATDQNGRTSETIFPGTIPAGEERNINVEFIPDQTWVDQNPHNFVVSVDPDNTIKETNEVNNRKVMPTLEVGYLKNAIIQFKMSDADERTNQTINLMNEPAGFTVLTGHVGTSTVQSTFHSLYSFDGWWRNQRRLVTGVDRDVFKSQIFGPFILNVLPPDRNRGENCQETFEPFFKAKALEAGVNPDNFDSVIYVFLDKYRDPGDPMIGNSGYQGTISSCSEQNRQAFIGIWNTTIDKDAMQIVLHEAGHILGAGDSYRPIPVYCADPEGLPEPNKVPKFPQNKACLMCEKVVLDPTAPVDYNVGDVIERFPYRDINDIDEDVMCREAIVWP